MALASGETNYMAPASARQMASDLALLPMWYADAGSAVLAPSAYNADFLKTKSELLSMDVALLTEPEVADGKDGMNTSMNQPIRKRNVSNISPESFTGKEQNYFFWARAAASLASWRC